MGTLSPSTNCQKMGGPPSVSSPLNDVLYVSWSLIAESKKIGMHNVKRSVGISFPYHTRDIDLASALKLES